MAEDGYPSVYVVDSHATRPPVPMRQNQVQRRHGVAQTLLFLLVSLALCGMAVEACLIYHLYQSESATSASSSKLIGGEAVTYQPSEAVTYQPGDVSPSKPVAHLTDGQDVVHGKEIMAWSMVADPLLYEIDYKDGNLVIQKEGYYYVYSKVFFFDSDKFNHYINVKSKLYPGGYIPLLQAQKYSQHSNTVRSNSYLGGVFHFYKDDAIFVKVSSTSKLDRHKSFENTFGAFMI
uniref:tumor necrosis factor ligand superfamily member 14 n=1 Tax=Monopterus albus TaxID=43700 RepID=UPI0009B45DE2|nr:tumor necrosis factor ligand superfamily member 14-like [Monopterus albus]XP_020466169.1 tumor necrosis factor ligand superfamily member 14-like [Monopterus albus]